MNINMNNVSSQAFTGKIKLKTGEELTTFPSQDYHMLSRIKSAIEADDVDLQSQKWDITKISD